MSVLTNVKIEEVNGIEVIMEIAQIHPDASLNFDLANDDLKATAFILLVDLLGRANKKSFLLINFPNIPDMIFPGVDEINKLVEEAEITNIHRTTAWEDGYFNDMPWSETLKPENWNQIPKMTIKIVFKKEDICQGIQAGLEEETSFDSRVLEWAKYK